MYCSKQGGGKNVIKLFQLEIPLLLKTFAIHHTSSLLASQK